MASYGGKYDILARTKINKVELMTSSPIMISLKYATHRRIIVNKNS